MAIYSTTAQQGIDVNAVFFLDLGVAPEYPAPPFQPGEIAWGTDGSEFVFCTASISLAPGTPVLISVIPGAWSVALMGGATLAAPIGQLVAVTPNQTIGAPSGTQTGSYFWAQRAGNCPNLALASGGTGTTLTQLRTSATQTGLTAAAGGGTGTTFQVTGIAWTQNTATVGSVNTAVLNYPYVNASN